MKKKLLYSKPVVALGSRNFWVLQIPVSKICPSIVMVLVILFSCVTVNAQRWRIVGNEQQIATTASSFTDITTIIEGGISVPYVVYAEAGAAKVKKLSGGAWQQVGGNITTASASYTRIVADRNGKLFVSYQDGASPTTTNKLAVRTYNTATSVWEPLNGNANNLYVSNGSVAITLSQYNSTPRSQMAFDTANRLHIVFGDDAPNLYPNIKRFNGTAWESVGAGPIFSERAVGVGISIDSTTNTPYMVYIRQANASATTGSLVVVRYNGTTWDSVPVPGQVAGGSTTTGATASIRHSSITFNKIWNPVVTYFNTGSNNRGTAIIYDKPTSTWNLSQILSARDAPNSSLVRDRAGNVYASFTDAYTNGGTSSIARVFRLPADSTIWRELKNAEVINGIDSFAGNLSIAPGNDSSRPFLIYTKTNSSAVVTPIVLAYNNANTPLPVKFGGLSAAVTSLRQVQVEWKILTEINAASYIVEKSGDGIHFNTIGNVHASGKSTYSLIDISPINGTNYYRVTALDKDGKSTNSPIVSINMGGVKTGLSIYPNPVRGNAINVQLTNLQSGKVSVALYNKQGQRLATTIINYTGGAFSQLLQLPSGLSSGSYKLVVNDGRKQAQQTLVVVP